MVNGGRTESEFGFNSHVYECDEAFVTGTFGGVVPVAEVDNHELVVLPDNSLVSNLQAYYFELVDSESTL